MIRLGDPHRHVIGVTHRTIIITIITIIHHPSSIIHTPDCIRG